MNKLRLKNINKIYDPTGTPAHIVKNANLSIDEGEFVVFVGPSGCGKSTMLRMIAGLEDITGGELLIDNQIVNDLSPSERGIGMVFQSYALYPHMTVRENIAFGVKYTKSWSSKQTSQAVESIAEALELTHLLDRKPSEMSGGQRQRVAIGRALIREPKVFLLDEPLSNLDAALRVRMRMQIAAFHRQFKSTTIYVTHDQVEAMTLADKVVVLNKGNIEQIGSPLELYHFPRTEFVANFIGSPKMNMVDVTFIENSNGKVVVDMGGKRVSVAADGSELTTGQSLKLGIRPEDIQIGSVSDIPVYVTGKELLGAESILYTSTKAVNDEFLVRCPGTLNVNKQDALFVKFPETACHLFVDNGVALKRNVDRQTLFVKPEDLVPA